MSGLRACSMDSLDSVSPAIHGSRDQQDCSRKYVNDVPKLHLSFRLSLSNFVKTSKKLL